MAAQVQTGAGNVTSNFANTGTTAGPVNRPANTADNDVLVACAYGRSNTAQYTGIPTGWVTVDPDGTRETATGWQTLFYKPITSAASEPSTYQWTGGSSGRHLVMVVRVTGADLAALLDDAGDDALAVGGTPQTLPMPAVTPTGSDSLLITCESTQTGTGAAASILNPPAGVTKIATVSTTSGSQNNHLGMSYQQLTSAGSTGVLTFTASSTLQSGVGYGLTLKSGVTSTNVNLTGQPVGSTMGAPAGTMAVVSSVSLTGAVTGSTTGSPAGTVSAASTASNVALTGGVVASTTGAPTGTLTLTTVIDDTGAVVGSTTAAPAGTLSLTSVVNVALTGGVVGSATATPAGTVSASSGATNVTLAGAVAGSTTGALAGTLTISSVGNVTLVGQPVGSGSGTPDGGLTLVSVGNVNLTGPPVGSVTTAPAGTRTTVTNVTLAGLVATSQTQALAGLLEVVSSSSVNLDGLGVGTTSAALAGTFAAPNRDLRTPLERTLSVPPASRTYVVPGDNRTTTVPDTAGD